jgi:hypothetical protein
MRLARGQTTSKKALFAIFNPIKNCVLGKKGENHEVHLAYGCGIRIPHRRLQRRQSDKRQ